ncbi:uncharacterized protein [Arachis hypogaea]|uniref:uncharacterized protein n=1 Tax=Arachis hypogaea TaxID=3818 RepID=UPI003B21081E
MPKIDPNIFCHKLAINPLIRPISQKKRHLGADKRAASIEETTKLLNTGFIKELQYSTWLANVVMVKKNNGYNQILMHEADQDKVAFITDNSNFCYKVMPFGLNNAGKPLYLYLSITDHAISSVLVTEIGKQQHSVYFISKSLQNVETRYPKLEKLALALVTTARRLRHYFQSHTIVVRTEQPLRQILAKPELAGRLIKWLIELSEYDIQYQSRGAIKSQALANFIAVLTAEEQTPKDSVWTLYIDGASNSKGSRAGILLEGDHGIQFKQSLQFTFHASNNQAEYEALIAGLRLAQTMGITRINIKCDSLLFSSVEHPQTNGLAKAANKIILQGLKKKLDDSKREWAELIHEVLWSYNTTEQSSTKETPFRLVYGCDVMIPIEVSLQNIRTTNTNENNNIANRRVELDLIEEDRDKSALQQLATKRAIARKYNKKIKTRIFLEGDLVFKKVEDIRKPQGHGKLSANWEGPFRIHKVIGKGAYKL